MGSVTNIGVAGTGMMAQEALPVLKRAGWSVTALSSTERSADTAAELCEKHGIGERFTDFTRLLAEADVGTVYIAVSNDMHRDFAMRALEAGKNVIVEKPIAASFTEAKALSEAAKARGLFLFEAISTLYLPNFKKIAEWLPKIGKIKTASCNFSQYSSRYDAFRAGESFPVFDAGRAGGALMDLGVYNLHFLMGLFGAPEAVSYLPNIEGGVDTSGLLTLKFRDFSASSFAAKDCGAPPRYLIEGDRGYILMDAPANSCGRVTLRLNDGTEESFDDSPESRLLPELEFFRREIEGGSTEKCYEKMRLSLEVSRVMTEARGK